MKSSQFFAHFYGNCVVTAVHEFIAICVLELFKFEGIFYGERQAVDFGFLSIKTGDLPNKFCSVKSLEKAPKFFIKIFCTFLSNEFLYSNIH
jgi:hypothetical protein